MPFNRREHLMLVVVILCVAALGADRLVATPLLRLWSTRAKRTGELTLLINKGSQLAAQQAKLEANWREMNRQSRSVEDSVTENQVLNAVSGWATASQLTVTSVKPHWNPPEEQCKKLEVRVSFSGSLASISRFVYELEADPQALKVEDLNLQARDDKGQTLNGDVRFTRLVLEDAKKR